MITFTCISRKICNGKVLAKENDILKTFYFILNFFKKLKDEKGKIIKKIKSFVCYFKQVWD